MYIHTYIIHTYILTYIIHTYILTYIHTNVCIYIHTYIHNTWGGPMLLGV